ncbi:MAG TPA: tRNA (guanosine(46)-N7)-methyltransferase TrmB [Woeseiaceae bacterium]|nr:tRNA (guanosine(46)-N7)-methyltransferase TrmB [Woeseiaceae bacterium]
MTVAQERAFERLWERFGIDFVAAPLALDAVFGRGAPRVLEIGFGNGETLVQQAREDPALDFVGVEVHRPGIGHCLLAAEKADLRNFRVIAHDAVEVLREQIPPGSLQRINLYFPDPWPKKRHHKRRLLQPAFLELVSNRLAPGGTLRVATDWQDYAEHIDEVVAGSGGLHVVERREHHGDRPLERPVTKFERRGLGRGHRIVDWCIARRDES